MKPIFRIDETSGITLKNMTVHGLNQDGAFISRLVGEAGIETRSAVGVTIDNVATNDTCGDGLELGTDTSVKQIKGTPSAFISVNGFSSTNAGRDGITAGTLVYSILQNITLVHSGTDAVDFESDLPGAGSENLIFTNVALSGIFDMGEALNGPITFNTMNWTGPGRVHVGAEADTAT